jgi:hypothetical protein
LFSQNISYGIERPAEVIKETLAQRLDHRDLRLGQVMEHHLRKIGRYIIFCRCDAQFMIDAGHPPKDEHHDPFIIKNKCKDNWCYLEQFNDVVAGYTNNEKGCWGAFASTLYDGRVYAYQTVIGGYMNHLCTKLSKGEKLQLQQQTN